MSFGKCLSITIEIIDKNKKASVKGSKSKLKGRDQKA
jgi:hypothetical protein